MRAFDVNHLHLLVEGVWFYRGFFSNSAVFVLPASVVVVDTQVTPEGGAALIRSIGAATTNPITHVVNTHYHGDHAGGNAAFAGAGAEIIASDDTRRLLHERDQERYEYARTFGLVVQHPHVISPPTRTFSGRLPLRIDGETLELMQIGRCETPDACIVHWPGRRVVAAGDGVATDSYPWTGVPFLDEGLADDGQWVKYLRAIEALAPEVLIPGHGRPLLGRKVIARRLRLLITLFTSLFQLVRREIAKGSDVPRTVRIVDSALRSFARDPSFRQVAVSQRFAILRAINALDPGRRGKGWWDDLRPSVVARASRDQVDRALRGVTTTADLQRASRGAAPALATALLERFAQDHDDAARAHGLLAWHLLRLGLRTRPLVDATEYLRLADSAARRCLERDRGDALGLLTAGIIESWSAMVVGHPQQGPTARLRQALAAGGLDATQCRHALFFLGKAHQLEHREAESDGCYRDLLPAIARPLFPLVRRRLRALP
jgi:glyoxylase-like metal-dependent hydrolase (beta-lactamase superfamily II)